MTPAFSARRRADEFEALLSRPPNRALTERDAERFAALLSVVDDLRSVPPVQARPEFVDGLRERLMVEADTVLVPRRAGASRAPEQLALPTGSPTRRRRLAAVLGGAAVVGATTSMAVAAQGALPGEALYPLKRAIESTEVRLASGDASRGGALLGHAEDRLVELEQLAVDDPAGASLLIPDTLDDFEAQADEGATLLFDAYDASGDEAHVDRVRDFAASGLDRLERLEDLVPVSARDELVSAGRTLVRLDEQAASACPTCRGGIAQVPDFLTQSSAPSDLLGGLDSDQEGLGGVSTVEVAPVSGQDLTGIEVPEELQVPGGTTTDPLRPEEPSPEQPTRVGDKVGETVKGTGNEVKETTNGVTGTVDQVTGGAVGGLTGDLDDATGGLIGDLTGGVDDVTGGGVTGSTDGLLD